jgi:putative oxidoreductase
MTAANQDPTTTMGITVLRIALGLMFLAHSVVLKLFTFGLEGTAAFFVSLGLPAWVAYATFFAEALGGAAILLGIKARWFALALSPILLGALFTAHAGNGWVFSAPGGGWEYPVYLFVLAISQFLLGDGALAVAPSGPLRLPPQPRITSRFGRGSAGLA